MINFNELPHAAKLSGALSNEQLALVSLAAYAAAGDADKLKVALQNARDALKSLYRFLVIGVKFEKVFDFGAICGSVSGRANER